MKSNKENIQLIIPMSGIGKRFIDAGYKDIKPMINVDGIPIIEHVLNLFPGVKDVTFICNKNHVDNTNVKSVLYSICPHSKIIEIDGHKMGPVYTVSRIFDMIDDNKEIIVSYCDYSTQWDFDKFLEEARVGNFDGSIPCYTGFHPHMLGSDNYAFCKEIDKKLIEIKEKEPFTNNKMNEYASNGTYYFKHGKYVKKYFQKLMDMNINLKGEYYISLVYNLMLKDKLNVNIFEIQKMLQWGTPYDLEQYKYWSNYFASLATPKENIKHPSETVLILPLAGKGSRFKIDGFTTPKPLINIDGLPMVVKSANCLPQCNNNVFICLKEHNTNYNIGQSIKQNFPNSKIVEIPEVTRGQAETCKIGIEASITDIETPILISPSDNGVYYNHEEYQKLVNDCNIDVIVWSFRNNSTSKINPDSYSWIDVDGNNFATHISCKKFTGKDPLKCHAIIGTMFFRKAKYFLDGFNYNVKNNITTNNEFYVDDILNVNITMGLKVKVFEVDYYICWGSPNDYKTYMYWKEFFNQYKLNPYNKSL